MNIEQFRLLRPGDTICVQYPRGPAYYVIVDNVRVNHHELDFSFYVTMSFIYSDCLKADTRPISIFDDQQYLIDVIEKIET